MYSNTHKRYVTVLLLVVYIFNQTDRAIFGFLMEPIKAELGFSDSQLGFLAGPALVLFYATLGIPIARWADRSNRVTIMSIAIALWSGIVTISAAVHTFWQFTFARIGVGIGEAGFSAIAQSLIADYHSAAERTRALSIFMLGLPLGVALSSLMGGWINEAYGWRAAFIAAGVPSLFLAVLLKATVQDPSRASASAAAAAAAHQPSLRSVFEMLWQRKALRHLAIAMTLLNMVTASAAVWMPTFFIRDHGMSTGELGTWIAAITGTSAAVGAWSSANLSNRHRVWDERDQARILAVSAALVGPLLAMVLLWPSAQGALLWLLPAYMLKYFLLGPTWSLLQGLCASSVRATMSAIVIFAQTMLAGAVGVQLVGLISDVLGARMSGGGSLRWALMITYAGAAWGAAHLWLAARSIRQDSRVSQDAIETSEQAVPRGPGA